MCIISMTPLTNVLSFSKWLKLAPTIVWTLHFAQNIHPREADSLSEVPRNLGAEETERIIICLTQKECFPDKLKSLKNGRGVPSRSSVKSLSQVFNTVDYLRRLIIAYNHELKHHKADVNHVLAGIRTRS